MSIHLESYSKEYELSFSLDSYCAILFVVAPVLLYILKKFIYIKIFTLSFFFTYPLFSFLILLSFNLILMCINYYVKRSRVKSNITILRQLSADIQDQEINGNYGFPKQERKRYYQAVGRESDFWENRIAYWEQRRLEKERKTTEERIQSVKVQKGRVKALMTRSREDIKLFLDKYETYDEQLKYIDDLSNYINHTYSDFGVDEEITAEIIELYKLERDRSVIIKALSELDYVDYDSIGDIYFNTYNPKIIHSDRINYYFVEAIADYYPETDREKLVDNIRAHIKKMRAKLFKLGLRADSTLFVENISDIGKVEFESYIKELYAYIGYEVEVLSENDRGADLILSHRNRKVAVQLRQSVDHISAHAIDEIMEAKTYYDCDRAMVVTNAYYTERTVECAAELNVELVNGRELVEMINSR